MEPPYVTTADTIIGRLAAAGVPYLANSNISNVLEPGDVAAIEAEAEQHLLALLRCLVIDVDHDHNTRDTAARVARMFVREVFAGRYQPQPRLTSFPNVNQVDQCYAVGPITVRSACSHHLVPIHGQAWVGVIPGERLIGLSKFHRLVEWVMARPQIQEEAANQLADAIEQAVQPRALAVIVRASHMCCEWRGVRDNGSLMTTSVMRGLFKQDSDARREFLTLIRGMQY